ncbi:MAG: DNA-directed RNA polymerase subunit omega [Flavobacterium sp.]
MSDNESDYYSPSSDSDNDDGLVTNVAVKKPTIMNAAKKFGNYIEDDSEPDDADVDEDDLDDDEMMHGGADDDDKKEDEMDDADTESDIEIDEDGELVESATKDVRPKKTQQLILDDDDDDDDDEFDENYLQKFDQEIQKNYVTEFHPECIHHNNDEVAKLSKVVRDDSGMIVDPLHKTLPYLTKYEKARVLGQRAKQIETGSKPFVKVPDNIIDGYVIAELELREKKIPFIIKRPIPGGAFEYWNLRDLELIHF